MTSNRRRFSRIPFRSVARIQAQEREFPVELLDISLKGALVRSDTELPVPMGPQVRLEICLDDAGILIAMVGTFVHREDNCFGLACHEIDLDSVTHLRRLVELNVGDESILDRELGALIDGL